MGIQLIVKPLPMRLGEIASDILNCLHDESGKSNPPDLNQFRNEEGELPYQIEALLGLFKGYETKEFDAIKGVVQPRFEWWEAGYPHIIGYGDLATYESHIAYEFKYTSRPEAYQNKFIVQNQIATQFLGIPSINRITLRAFQVPQLRLAKNESLADYRERVYQDFLARPLHYIHDTSYWRNEFNYDELREKYKMVAREIQNFIELGGINYFYQSNGPSTCFGDTTGSNTSNCEYLPICESGVISDLIYKKREVKQNEEPRLKY